MATFKFEGLDGYITQLREISDAARGCIKRAVFDGAAVVAKAVEDEIRALPENDHDYLYEWELPAQGVSKEQKRGLLEGMGLAKMQDDNGYINTKLGFDGYNDVKTKRYPNGQPNALIARSIESGSSIRRKNPFVTRGTKASKEKAEAAMASRLDADIQEIISK